MAPMAPGPHPGAVPREAPSPGALSWLTSKLGFGFGFAFGLVSAWFMLGFGLVSACFWFDLGLISIGFRLDLDFD